MPYIQTNLFIKPSMREQYSCKSFGYMLALFFSMSRFIFGQSMSFLLLWRKFLLKNTIKNTYENCACSTCNQY